MNDTQRIIPCGRLYTNGIDYFLINPVPVNPDWEKKFCYSLRFLVVPAFPVRHVDTVSIYGCPREIITTSFSIEYDTTIEPLVCESPCDFLDRLNEWTERQLANVQGSLS